MSLASAQRTVAVVLAAGKGTRMKSDLPKVLVPVGGRPMIEYVLDALASAGIGDCIIVVGYRADLVRAALSNRTGVTFVEQTQQLGTGHAVMVCRSELERRSGAAVFVLAGDSPMMQPSSLSALTGEFSQRQPACLIGTAYKDDPAGLGRVVRDSAGDFIRIVEEKDASESERRITEVNMSTYVFNCRDLIWALDHVRNDNLQNEYYITDVPGILKQAEKSVIALPLLKPVEALSINTVDELALVERELARMKQ